jgi:hypothetical protein
VNAACTLSALAAVYLGPVYHDTQGVAPAGALYPPQPPHNIEFFSASVISHKAYDFIIDNLSLVVICLAHGVQLVSNCPCAFVL